MPRRITLREVEALAMGGAILGGGGGGSPEAGRSEGRLALEIGSVELWSVEEADPHWLVVTCAALGAPTQRGGTGPAHFIRAALAMREAGVEYQGLIAAENGGRNSFAGWVVAAALGLPVVDAPGDGRAHPTALMGSMGLQRTDYHSVKVGVTEGSTVVARGTLESTGALVRAQASHMEAMVAMVRDPVAVSYAAQHGAPGAISQAISLGEAYLGAGSPTGRLDAVADYLGGEVLCEGRVVEKRAQVRGGFDVGHLVLEDGGGAWELDYINEYMLVERKGERLHTFPDLIATFNQEGEPVTSAAVEEGMRLYVLVAPKEKILVGDGNRYPEAYLPLEEALGKPLRPYLEGFLRA